MDALRKHIAQNGEYIDRVVFVGDAVDRGISAATAHRWINEAIQEARSPPRPARKNPSLAPETLPEVAVDIPEIVAALPRVPTMDDVATMGLLPVVKLLTDCINTAQDLIKQSRTPEGAVRNARLLLQGSEHLRRSVETAAKLNETVAIQQEIQRFHAIVMEEIGLVSRDVQERILIRLRRACDAASNL